MSDKDEANAANNNLESDFGPPLSNEAGKVHWTRDGLAHNNAEPADRVSAGGVTAGSATATNRAGCAA